MLEIQFLFHLTYEKLFTAWVNFRYFSKKNLVLNHFYCTTIRKAKNLFVIFSTRKIFDGKQVLVGWLGGTP